MIFGAAIAGMTSEGGGAVAFPVMTLVLGIEPTVARDFSLMIQSCGLLNQEILSQTFIFQSLGMTAVTFTILWMKIKLETHSLTFCTIGGIGGMILG